MGIRVWSKERDLGSRRAGVRRFESGPTHFSLIRGISENCYVSLIGHAGLQGISKKHHSFNGNFRLRSIILVMYRGLQGMTEQTVKTTWTGFFTLLLFSHLFQDPVLVHLCFNM